jgi:hypothetical protein
MCCELKSVAPPHTENSLGILRAFESIHRERGSEASKLLDWRFQTARWCTGGWREDEAPAPTNTVHGAFLGHKKSSVGLNLPSARLMVSATRVTQLKSNRPHAGRLRKSPDDALQKKASLASCRIRKIRPRHHVFGILWCLAYTISPPRSHMQPWSRS